MVESTGMLDTFRFVEDDVGQLKRDEVDIKVAVWPIS